MAGAAADHCGDRQLRHATGLGSGKGPARGGRHRMYDGYGGQSIVSENHCPLLYVVPPSQCVGETVQKLARLPEKGRNIGVTVQTLARLPNLREGSLRVGSLRGRSGFNGADQATTGRIRLRRGSRS